MTIKRITLPIAAHTRMRGTPDGNGGKLWVAAGPSTEIAEAVKAGGCHVMTNRGPRVILVDRVVKLGDGSLAIVPIEVDFAAAKSETTTAAVTEMTVEQLEAQLALLKATNGQTTTSRGKANGARKTTSGTAKTTSKTTTVKETPAAAAAVAEVDDEELADLLVS